MDNNVKKRWISLYVENQVGVLSKISGLFSAKSYNLDSLTVGTTEDPTVSRMTIATVSDDETFEQIKKQLNRTIEVIKVIDFTDIFVRMKEILYVKVFKCTPEDKVEVFQIAETFKAKVIDYGRDSVLVEFVQTATKKRRRSQTDEGRIQDNRSSPRRQRRHRIHQHDGTLVSSCGEKGRNQLASWLAEGGSGLFLHMADAIQARWSRKAAESSWHEQTDDRESLASWHRHLCRGNSLLDVRGIIHKNIVEARGEINDTM